MRVLHISGLRGWGGVFTFIKSLAEYQRHQQGLDSAVLSLLDRAEPQEQELRTVVPVHEGRLRSGWDASPRAHSWMLALMREYDVLHFHGFSPLTAAMALASRRTIVHTEHGTFQQANLRLSVRKYVRKRLLGFPFLEHGADAVVFISQWLQNDLNLRRRDSVVIHNGTGVQPQLRAERQSTGRFRVLSLGRFVVRKRFDRVIRGVSLVDQPGTFHLKLVGGGALEQQLRDQAAESLPAGSCEFAGFQRDVDALYDWADLVVLPTEFEPFGLVVAEAAMHGVPVVCFQDAGGAREILEGLDSRLIVEDETHLARALEFWRDHPAERRAAGVALFSRVRERFTLARMADDYLALYTRLAPDRRTFHAPATI